MDSVGQILRTLTAELYVENKTDVDLAIGVERRGDQVVLVLTRRDSLGAGGLIIPRGTINGRKLSS